MREIKFRQPLIRKSKFDSFHYWGFLSDGNFSSPSNDWVSQNKEYPSQQFIGLKDMHFVDIYEGDIVYYGNGKPCEVKWHQPESKFIFYQEFEKGGGSTLANAGHYLLKGNVYDKVEIIGNIYENPELLKRHC